MALWRQLFRRNCLYHFATWQECSPWEESLPKFDIDLSAPTLNFQTRSRSSCLVKMITPHELPAVCREVLHIKISDEFDVNIDFCLIFWNFQISTWSCVFRIGYLLELHALSNFTGRVSTSESQSGLGILTSDMSIFSNCNFPSTLIAS